MTDREWKEHNEKVEELSKKHPTIPPEVFDIEASEEMAELYYDDFGY